MIPAATHPPISAEHVAAFTIALAGNPNAGKSTLFNALTGSHQHVGNWPGKTVEKKEGRARIAGRDVSIVDLPGAYSLTAYSVEEIVTRDFLLEEHPDAVIAVLDAANLERNLYLVVQLIELGAPVIVALNMMDVAESQAVRIDVKALSAALGGVPVIGTIARSEIGLNEVKEAIWSLIQESPKDRVGTRRSLAATGDSLLQSIIEYGPDLESEISALQGCIEQSRLSRSYPVRWLAIKLLEGEADIVGRIGDPGLLSAVRQSQHRIAQASGEDAETLIVDRRYAFISSVAQQAIRRPAKGVVTLSDRLDTVLTHRWLGLPIFLALMWFVFQIVSNVSAPMVDWIDGAINGSLAGWIVSLLNVIGLHDTWVESLIVEGAIAGAGGMMVFLPMLFFLYAAIGILEDSGYMARAAFVMDRFMHALGLHGKSFLPLLLGFGCTVPAIYATRTLDSAEDRKLTAFLATFMSCGARLPVYVIFGSAFFGAAAGNLIFVLYVVGIGVAVLTGILLRRTVFKNKPAPPFVMELPPYRLPTAKGLWAHIRERSANFMRTVTTVILFASILLWFLLAIPANSGEFRGVEPRDSLFGAISGVVAPIFAPAGFGTQEAAGALMTGLLAKELAVATLGQIFVGGQDSAPPDLPTTSLADDAGTLARSFGEAVILTAQEAVNIVPRTVNLIPGVAMPEADFLRRSGEEETDSTLESALRNSFSPLAAVAFNVFVLLYIPCMSSSTVMRKEFGTRWMLFQMGYTLLVAWAGATVVFQIGTLLGLGGG